jgi:hypothetical protein
MVFVILMLEMLLYDHFDLRLSILMSKVLLVDHFILAIVF